MVIKILFLSFIGQTDMPENKLCMWLKNDVPAIYGNLKTIGLRQTELPGDDEETIESKLRWTLFTYVCYFLFSIYISSDM